MSIRDRLFCLVFDHDWEAEYEHDQIIGDYHVIDYDAVCAVCGQEKEASRAVEVHPDGTADAYDGPRDEIEEFAKTESAKGEMGTGKVEKSLKQAAREFHSEGEE